MSDGAGEALAPELAIVATVRELDSQFELAAHAYLDLLTGASS
jgi:hypothetical protein